VVADMLPDASDAEGVVPVVPVAVGLPAVVVAEPAVVVLLPVVVLAEPAGSTRALVSM
jgi:hypothetical protein